MAWIELATNQLGIWDIPDSPEALNNAQIIWDFFKGMLFSDESIAGILGNMAQESMLNPHQFGYNASMTDPYTPRGLIMWTTQANIQNMYNYMNDPRRRDFANNFFPL